LRWLFLSLRICWLFGDPSGFSRIGLINSSMDFLPSKIGRSE